MPNRQLPFCAQYQSAGRAVTPAPKRSATNLVSNNEANVSAIDEKKFQEQAEQTKKPCLVSIAVAGPANQPKAKLINR